VGATPAASINAGTTVAAPSRSDGATIAQIVVRTDAWTRPDGTRRRLRLSTQTSWSGEPQSLLVLGSTEVGGQEWLRVLLPIRPNDSSAWIARSNVLVSHTPYWVTITLHRRQVAVYRAGRLRRRFTAVVGKRSTPTPLGLAAIYERDRQPDANGFVGSWALPLTALSNKLHSFDGGPGRVAIHGRGGDSLRDPLGSARSHGCIRVDNGAVSWLAHRLPIGAPVLIER